MPSIDGMIVSWRHPSGTRPIFDSAYAAKLIETFNRSAGADLSALDNLLRHAEPLAVSLLE